MDYTIKERVLCCCSGEEDVFVVPYGVMEIGSLCFGKCKNLKKIIMPETVVALNEDAFCGLRWLEEIQLPKSLVSIQRDAFRDCEHLTEIKIGKNVVDIGGDVAFAIGCNNLERIVVDDENEVFSSEDGVLFNKAKTCLIKYPAKKKENEYVLPSGVVQIAKLAFEWSDYLETVTFPASLKKIKSEAFADCKKLSHIVIPDNVTQVEPYAFYGCSSLTSAKLSANMKVVSKGLFEKCCALESVCLSQGIKKIGADAFCRCASLKTITLPNGLTEIEEDAFFDSGLRSIVFPDTVNKLGSGAFKLCKQLKRVVLSEIDCIRVMTFEKCEKLKNITIPYGVYSVGDYAFADCTSLKSIVLQPDFEHIGLGAFSGCTKLEDITLPDYIMDIGIGAFDNTAYYQNKNNWTKDGQLYIGNCLIEKSSEHKERVCVVRKGTTTIANAAFDECRSLVKVVLPKSLTYVGIGIFSNTNIENVIFPEDVEIHPNALDGCSKLKNLTILNGKEEVDSESVLFSLIGDKNDLEEIHIPKSYLADDYLKVLPETIAVYVIDSDCLPNDYDVSGIIDTIEE